MNTILRLVIPGACTLIISCISIADTSSGSLTSDPRDRDVVKAAIAGHLPSERLGYPWAFAVETGPRVTGEFERLIRDSTEPQAKIFVEDVVRRNDQTAHLPIAELTFSNESIVWVDPAELPSTNHASSSWRALHARAPGVRRVWRFTRPAYDPTRTRAFLIETEVCAPEADICELRPITLELRLIDGRWTRWRIQTIPPDSAL
jgi:hypothetical protein